MTLHTGEMPYECHICGRKVRVLSNLYKHFMVHKKNKTYYSKKDGLPDPLDSYLAEQEGSKTSSKSPLNPKAVHEDAAETEEDPDELKVNRSTSQVITYGGGAKEKVTPPSTTPQPPQNQIVYTVSAENWPRLGPVVLSEENSGHGDPSRPPNGGDL